MSGNTNIFRILGTDANDDFIGSSRTEWFWGFGGRDRIYAKGGDDQLMGGAGNDVLDGGEGRDVMYGGAGNDSYIVDDPGDTVSEQTVKGADDGGDDIVVSNVAYALETGLERLTLSGSKAIDGSGNDLDNYLRGNGQSNVLSGGSGSDKLYGYGGDDTLIGGAGRDYMTGGAGADTFVFGLEAGQWDRIYDLAGEDRIGIETKSFGLSEGNGLVSGVLDSDWFVEGNAATAAGHGQFVFKAARGELLWDADGAGTGRAVRVALIDASAGLTHDRMSAYGLDASVEVKAFDDAPRAETGGAAYFAVTLTAALAEDVLITLRTVDGTAHAGQDYIGTGTFDVTIRAGATTAYVPVMLIDDVIAEGVEAFSLRIDDARGAVSGKAYGIDTAQATTAIDDEGPCVVAETKTAAYGITDPSAIAYDAATGHLIVTDSEVDEAPFHQADNIFVLELDGSLVSSAALPFTREPTGLAADDTGHLWMTDDDKYQVFRVAASDPTTVQWQTDTRSLGAIDPEDIAFDSDTGNLFICNGLDRRIVEMDADGALVSSIVLPATIVDPEALVYDAQEGVFYVGGGFSDSIWKVDRSGSILDEITVLQGARADDTNHRVSIKDLEFAPASDGSGERHLYVADYGWSHEADGRIIEIDLGDGISASDWFGV